MFATKLRLHLNHHNEDGQAIVEYALILALITVVSVTALTLMGETVGQLLTAVATRLSDIAAGM